MHTQPTATQQHKSLTQPRTRNIPSMGQSTGHPAVTLGRLVSLRDDGQPLVHWATSLSHAPIPARSQVALQATDQDRECTLAFIDGDPAQPVILGLLQPLQPNAAGANSITKPNETTQPIEPVDSAKPVDIQSNTAITLQAGRTKLELHADGRILLQGRHIRSQAYGPNQLKGSSIKLN